MRKPCLVLTGPTAVGKTRLSLALAHRIRGSVISADSMQVYRGMDIGSIRISIGGDGGNPPLSGGCSGTGGRVSRSPISADGQRGHGGNLGPGTHPRSYRGNRLLYPSPPKKCGFFRQFRGISLRPELEKLGEEALYQRLLEKDPEAAEAIHPHNRKRVIRALEYCLETGRKISDHNQRERQRPSPYCCGYFVLNDEREKLYRQIDRRVDLMIEKGLVEEVRRLAARGLTEENTSMKGLGYKELFPYLRGEMELDEAVRIIKRDTRHFAKRQLTWFRREPDVIWINKQEFGYSDEKILTYILRRWQEILREEEEHESRTVQHV